MKFAIISDTHFGDPMCTLVDHKTLSKGKKYDKFVKAAGVNNDYLILLGDIFDFSIASYSEAYRVAKAFFLQINKDDIAKNIIYVPGNHDFAMWNTVEQQIKTVYQVGKGRPAKEFSFSVPGFIDVRANSSNEGFQLPGVTGVIDPDAEPTGVKLFLNSITKNEDGSGRETNFYFAYPNIYFVSGKESILITHGHYLDAFWSLAGEWELKIAREDLKLGDEVDLREMVALNFPLCQLSCSGIGQARPLTELVRKVQREVKDRKFGRVERYLNNLDNEVDKLTPYKRWDPREWGSDAVSNFLKKQILEAIKKSKDTRYSEEFIHKKEVLNRFRNFFESSWVEICQLNEEYDLSIPLPNKVIFGHTHQLVRWGAKDAPWAKVIGGNPVRLYNTGGWLWRLTQEGKREFCGAEVFTFENASGFASHTIT